jgi:hypothetical protein
MASPGVPPTDRVVEGAVSQVPAGTDVRSGHTPRSFRRSVLVSGTAFDHVRNKVDTGFEDLGTQPLRNIAEPVRVYRVPATPRVPVYSFVFVSARLDRRAGPR